MFPKMTISKATQPGELFSQISVVQIQSRFYYTGKSWSFSVNKNSKLASKIEVF